jgi:hypothetical protein
MATNAFINVLLKTHMNTQNIHHGLAFGIVMIKILFFIMDCVGVNVLHTSLATMVYVLTNVQTVLFGGMKNAQEKQML